jgi:hypothetical protein
VYRQRRRTLGISLRGTAAVLEWVKSVFDTAIPTAKPVPVRISSGYPYYSVLGKRAEKCYLWLYRSATIALSRKRQFVDELLREGDINDYGS